MPRVICLILGGGRGTRLFPLTKSRSKPAVPIAGKYRLIDIPISNCIHSGLNRIFVLTQFNSVSLHRHIANTYKFDPFGGGFVEILAAQQTMQHETWYQGTADAVRRNIPYFTEKPLRPGPDPLRRPALPDGLPGHDPHPPREQGRSSPSPPCRWPRTRPRRAGSCGSRPTAGSSTSRRSPRPRRSSTGSGPTPTGWSGWASRRRAAPTWPAWASTCSTADPGRAARRRATPPTSARSSSPRRSPTTASRPTCSTATGRTSGPSAPSTRRTST